MSRIGTIGKSLVTAAFLIALTAPPAGAGVIEPVLEDALRNLPEGETVPVILTLADRVDPDRFRGRGNRAALVRALQEKADRAQPPLQARLRSRGIGATVQLWAINGLAFSAQPETVRELAAMPGVERIGLDALLKKPEPEPEPEPVPEAVPEWNLIAIGAPELWALGNTGSGTVVAGLDTGVDVMHPDLAGNWREGVNSWYDPNGEHAAPYDPFGHGTQTMGLAVGGSAGGTSIGVAPGASWIAVKIFNDAGYASLSGIHQGLQWLLDPDGDLSTDDAPDVVLNSWGIPGTAGECFTEFEIDLALLRAAEIAVVFAAGNDGPDAGTSSSPANNPGSFAAGAVDEAQNLSYTSSRGPSACDASIYPEVVAPGEAVRTSDLSFGGAIPDPYATVSGTSFAAPHVAGTMALLLSFYPGVTVDELEQALTESAVDLGLEGPDNDSGYGMIDAFAASQRLLPASVCTDADGDGFFAEAGCGIPQDCDDGDAGVHPGAAETGFDGIDQDCNGYDLTIAVIRAEYAARQDLLTVEAVSSLGPSADLMVVGYGNMKWDKKKEKWTLTVRWAGGNPGTITVSGREGEISAPVQ